jgi:hypothetical protein
MFVMLAGGMAMAQMPPQAMPGNPEEKAAAKALPTSPTVSSTVVQEAVNGCDSGTCCPERPGLLGRISAHWSGHRTACVNPGPGCTNSFPSYGNYTPIIVSYAKGCVESDDRCRRFGLNRFFGRCPSTECKTRGGALSRLKAWFRIGRCESSCDWKMMPTPYVSPVRYYFGPDGEPNSGSACADGSCGEGVSRFGCVGDRGGLGSNLGGGRLGSRISTGLGEGCRNGHCKREQCYNLAGTPFNGNGSLRYARDEKPMMPPIVAGKPGEYEGSWHYDRYGAKPADANVQQTGFTERK